MSDGTGHSTHKLALNC